MTDSQHENQRVSVPLILPLQSSRLTLRRLENGDLERFLMYRNDPNIACYQSWTGFTEAEALAFIEQHKVQEPARPGQWLQIGIALRESNLLIGDCGLHVHANDPRQATFGITLSRDHQSQGFATEALSALFDTLFGTLRLHRVIADTDPRNAPAWTLFERLGMRREADLKQSLWFKGNWVDEYIYAILHEEWVNHRTLEQWRLYPTK